MPTKSDVPADSTSTNAAPIPWRRVAAITAAFSTVIGVILCASAVALAVCIPTAYSVTASAPPASANWTDTSGLWVPAGGFPGCAPGDSAADTNASPTTIIINSAIANPIIGLNLSCNGCVIDIQSGGSLTLAGAGTIGSGSTLRISGGTLNIASGGALTFQAGSQFQLDNGFVDVQTGGQLDLNVTSSAASGATLQVSGGTLNANAPFTVQSGGRLNLIDAVVAGSGTITNSGIVETTGGSSSQISNVFNNAGGTLLASTGTLYLYGGGNGDGPYTLASGATIDFHAGTYTLTPNGVISGAGQLAVTGATLTIGGVTTPAIFTLTSGLMNGPGFLSIGQSFYWDGGTIAGTGGAELAGGAAGVLSGVSGAMTLTDRTFTNYGHVYYSVDPAAGNSPLTLTGTAQFNTYGLTEINADGSIFGGSGTSMGIFQSGALIKSQGTGTSTINPPLTNDALVEAYSGTLVMAGNGTHSGFFIPDAGATIAFGASETLVNGWVYGGGNVSFLSGSSTELDAYYSIGGKTSIANAYVTFDSSAQTKDFLFDGAGTLGLYADFDMTGTGTWSAGTIQYDDGTFYVDAGATLYIDSANGNTTLDTAVIENYGTIRYYAGASLGGIRKSPVRTLATSSGGFLDLTNGSTIFNDGLFSIETDTQIGSGASTVDFKRTRISASSLTPAKTRTGRLLTHRARTLSRHTTLCGCPNDIQNYSTMKKTSAIGSTDFGPAFYNEGTLLAGTGTIKFLDSFDQASGTTTLGAGNIEVTSPLNLSGGELNGAGTVTGNVSNTGGTVSPGGTSTAATINISGTYTQGSGGNLKAELSSPSSYDILAVAGSATLDGTLNVSLINSYLPANGDAFDPLTYASFTGDFATKNLPTWNGTHGSMTTSENPTAYHLTAVVTPSSADLSAAGLTGPATVNAGASLVYTIQVGQNGPDSIPGTVTLVNTLPAGVTGASGSGSGWSCGAVTGGTITCTMPGPVAVGPMPMLTFSMTAPVSGGIVTDSVTVSSATNDPSPSNNSKSVTTTVVAQADLGITKTGPTGVTAGQNVTYTIVVTNNGPSTATGVTVSDPQPANLTFVSNTGACTTSYPCTLGSLNSGQSVTITSTYSTSPSFSGNVTNTATVSGTTADPNNTNDSISFTTNVGAQADLLVTKTGPASTNPGQNVTYTVTVTNNGPSPATSTVVSDTTPVGIAFLSNTGACVTPYPCSLGTLASGQTATITTTYSVPPSYSGGAINNTASASSPVNDPNNTNNSATATTTVGASADVAITKSGPANATLGANITYTITVSNFGPSGATGVVVSDPTPAGLGFVSASGGGCTSFPCTIGALAVGPPVTITATYSVPSNYAGASITNTASVTSASDPNGANNTASTTATVSAQADLIITKTGPASATPGSSVSYAIGITNSGALAAANTFLNDPTPAGLTPVAVSGGGCSSFPCSLGTINAGGSVGITATYSVPANYPGTSISNTASVSTSSPESNGANNTATAITPISTAATANLIVSKGGPVQATANGVADFTVIVNNQGPNTATNVVISDPTPVGLDYISSSGACSTPFPCTVASLPSGSFVSVTTRYRILAQSGSITNTASVTSSATDPVPSNNTSSATMAVLPAPVCPQPPQLVAPLSGASVAAPVTFSWNSSSGATGYVVTINGLGSSQTISTQLTSITQPLANGAYTWSVQVLGSASCQPTSTPAISFSVCSAVGTPIPSVVSVTTTGQTYAVDWTAIDGAVSYELQESTDAAFGSPSSTTLLATSQSFTKNVSSPTGFFYRVRATGGCNQAPGSFSGTASIVIITAPPLGSININIPVPTGSKQPVTFPIHVDGLPNVTTSFFATVDKSWLAVTPTSGIMPPEGLTFTISEDPSTLQDGTWTGTVIIVFGSSGVSGKTALDVAPKTSIPVSISLTTPVTPGVLSVPASTAVVIPSVGHLAGLSSQWQSDIRIANITSSSKKVQLTFSAGSATSQAVKQTNLSIDAGATTALDDIVRNWFGVGPMNDSSNGVLTVQPLDSAGRPDVSVSKVAVASSRTFNASAVGTLGQFIPAVPLASFISKAPGANSSILALQQIAQTNTFRTNLGVVEATGKPASVLVSVFDGLGSRLLDLPLTLAGGEQRQLNSFLADKGISLTNGHIEVQATSGEGKVTAYASVIDSRSTDPLLVSGVPIGGTGATRFVIPGVASIDSTATWRSDVRIFNGSLTPQTTTLTLYPTGNPSASLARDVIIQPGEVKALDDIVHATFNLTNAGGALHVTTAVSVPLVVTARTYDDTSAGTLGQFVQAVTPADAVGAGDRSLQLLQMEDSPRYRANLGLAEVTGKAVTAEVTVILPDSKVSPKVQIPLGAFEYRQFPILSSLGLGNTYNARISVRVIDGQGKITAYGSVIDQKTQDPTFVPAQ